MAKNRLILGGMNFGPDPSQGARVLSAEAVRELLRLLKSQGYSEIDTARIYTAGKSEAILATASYSDLGFSLATKVYPTVPGTHVPEKLKEKFAESLAALKTDSVDIFYLHAADRAVPFVQTLAAVNELYLEGKFKTFGLSNYASYEVAEIVMTCRAVGWIVPTVYQAMYNPLTRAIEKELVPCCRRFGLDIVAYNPLAGGLLTRRYTSQPSGGVPEFGRFSNTFEVQGSLYRDRYMTDRHFAALHILQQAAEKEGISLVQLSLRWLANHSALKMKDKGGNDGVVVGVSSVAQLQENIEAFEGGPLSKECALSIERAWKVTEEATTTYWRGKLEYSYDPLAKENL